MKRVFALLALLCLLASSQFSVAKHLYSSREAAAQQSPGRKPWDRIDKNMSPGGAAEISGSNLSDCAFSFSSCE